MRRLSRAAAPDVDGWIAQARKLQDDIKHSQETAKEIVQLAESGKAHAAQVEDASNNVSFLQSEIAHKESLARTLEQLRDMATLLESAQNATIQGNTMYALQTLEDAHGLLQTLGPFQSTRPVSLLQNKEEQLRKNIIETVSETWKKLIVVDPASHKISIKQPAQRETAGGIDTDVDALIKLNLFDTFIARLSRDLDQTIIHPRLTVAPDKSVAILKIEGDQIQCQGRTKDKNIKAALGDIETIADFLTAHLPSTVVIPLSTKLVPVIASRLISNLLLPAVPLSTDGVHDFQETLGYVIGMKEYFDELGWSGQNHLLEWVDKSPEIWLARQKETAIAKVQTMFAKKVQEKKTVERVETQVVTKGDALHTGEDEQEDDWGAEWGDEDATKEKEAQKTQDLEEEDMSAWGEEEETASEPKAENQSEAKPADEEDAEDWGADWGDEEATKSPVRQKPATKVAESPMTNGKLASQKSAKGQEVTLRETYTATAIPDSIMEIIVQVIMDVETLNSSEFVKTTIAPASGGLYAIPSLLLAMYRATASVHYSRDIAGNMLIYNDCQRLSDRLRLLLNEQGDKDKVSKLPQHLRPYVRLHPKLNVDIKSIEDLGKRAYGREMESQRQILRDHLEDAQGFQGCTNVPFATVCDEAIATTIDRIGDVKRQWQNVLSNGTLLQSLGSLVSTALTKFVNDVEDMSDIAEDDSRKLHGYCNSLATLAQYFQVTESDGETRDMVGIYTPNWFKFQWLSEILDSNLADIKHFWTNSELRLEMEAEEVVGLIEALFAASDHRRRAIAEIRRTSMA